MEDGEVEAVSSALIESEASRQVEDVRHAPQPLQPTVAHASSHARDARVARQAPRPEAERANAAQTLAEQAEAVAHIQREQPQVASQATEQADAERTQSVATQAEPHSDGHADQSSTAAASRQSMHSETNSMNETARGARRGGQRREESVTASQCARMPCSRTDIQSGPHEVGGRSGELWASHSPGGVFRGTSRVRNRCTSCKIYLGKE